MFTTDTPQNTPIDETALMSPTGGALASAGGDILGGLISWGASAQQAKKAYERQRILIQEQRDYNTPQKQMERLKEAGINPHMAYAKGGFTNTSTNAGTSVQQGRAPQFNIDVARALKIGEELKNLRQNRAESESRENLNLTGAKLNNAKAEAQRIDNFFNDYVTGYTGESRYVTVNGAKYDVVEATKLWLKNDLKVPPRLESYLYDNLRKGVAYQTEVSNKEIRQAEAYLKQAGYTFTDDLAVRMGVMIAKSEGLDIETTQGLTALYEIISGIAPLLMKGKMRGQRGVTESERKIYNREGTYMGSQKTTTKRN